MGTTQIKMSKLVDSENEESFMSSSVNSQDSKLYDAEKRDTVNVNGKEFVSRAV